MADICTAIGIKYHSKSNDALSFNRLKMMLENPATIPQPGAQHSPMATSSVPSPPVPASYAGGYHNGVLNAPVYRGPGYNSGFRLECLEDGSDK